MKATSPIFANVVSPGLGRVFEATVWRARPCPAVLGSLYPSRRHFQPSDSLRHRIGGSIPLEGLCESRQEAHDDSNWRRVPSPVPPACAAQRLSPDSILRMVGQPEARTLASTLPPFARSNTETDRRGRTLQCIRSNIDANTH